MFEFPKIYFPLAKWIDRFVDWLTVQGDVFFDVISRCLLVPLLGLERGLLYLPWFVIIAVLAFAAWKLSGWKLALGATLGLLFIGVLGLWKLAMSTLAIVIAATVLAVLIGVPIGISMARSDFLERLIRPILDLMQTMPSFVYLIPALMLFGLGKVPALLSTCIYAAPPAIRLTNLGIRQVSPDVIECGKAFGSTPRQLLFKVQLPLAMPTIMAGVNQTIMMALSMVVIASMIGAGGLGKEVLSGIAQLKVGKGFTGGISIVILAVIMDRLTQALTQSQTKHAI
ncbi:ABC transporter permease [candidate division KSB3 bacterium]|uniref:ABC transporter permease n=1 Tax=candidate division KSB3 bacterium TaxID=2044937 RepID=A0A2G6E2H9_9BACT|nr:MAG: ABC transporter permease [candidate division KSB3 bacterium]PIE28822.1 MAG: ABC transporter permease [candidate division KSB3 bacterium]